MSPEDIESRVARVEEKTEANGRSIKAMQADIASIRNDQKAIYDLSASVQVMVQKMTQMAEKLDDTNTDVKGLSKEVSDVKTQLAEVDTKADRQVAKNWNQIKVAIITAVCTLLITGAISAIVMFAR